MAPVGNFDPIVARIEVSQQFGSQHDVAPKCAVASVGNFDPIVARIQVSQLFGSQQNVAPKFAVASVGNFDPIVARIQVSQQYGSQHNVAPKLCCGIGWQLCSDRRSNPSISTIWKVNTTSLPKCAVAPVGNFDPIVARIQVSQHLEVNTTSLQNVLWHRLAILIRSSLESKYLNHMVSTQRRSKFCCGIQLATLIRSSLESKYLNHMVVNTTSLPNAVLWHRLATLIRSSLESKYLNNMEVNTTSLPKCAVAIGWQL